MTIALGTQRNSRFKKEREAKQSNLKTQSKNKDKRQLWELKGRRCTSTVETEMQKTAKERERNRWRVFLKKKPFQF